jgi:murein DD-endopeptidase MepM/ murein hydrolase activator NlpD
MQGKQFKLIYFSLGGSDAKQLSIGWKTIIGVTVAAFTVILLLTIGIIGIFTDVFHNTRISHLSKANTVLSTQLSSMEENVSGLEEVVKKIEKDDEDLRVFVDLPPHAEDTRRLGVGGRSFSTYATSSLDTKIREKAFEVNQAIDDLSRRLEYAKRSRETIQEKYTSDRFLLSTTPSIRPVIGGRVSAPYGLRVDPFIEKYKAHEGIDFSISRGTPVYATAEGKVIEVVARHRPNKGYGKYVVIDHGNGYHTKYAHLQRSLVKEGQRIKRHETIGLVGDTGRSTGPHLHYEVIKEGMKINPDPYILE